MTQFVKVAPTNVENKIITHPAVEDVAVIGVPHDVDGEHPLAFVVLNVNYTPRPSAEEIVKFTEGIFCRIHFT